MHVETVCQEWISSIVLPVDGMPSIKGYAVMKTVGTGQTSDAWMIRVRDGRDKTEQSDYWDYGICGRNSSGSNERCFMGT